MHLVAYTDAAGVGGAEISLGNLVAALAAHPDVEVTVLGRSAEVVHRVAGGRVAAHVAPVRRHPELLARLRPDVVHANLSVPWACATGIATALALPRTRVLAVQQLPLRTVDLASWLRTRALLRRLDAHVAVGRESSRRVEDFYALGRGSVRSIPNFVPDVPLPPRPAADGRPYTIGSLGRLDRVKGYDLLLEAVAELPGARLVVVGEGAERLPLQKQASELGVAERVELPGWDQEPRRRLVEWDVFCLPSRSEGFPLSIVEAMLAGLPVVASRVGSVAEAVQPETGLLVERDDVAGLVAALGELRDPGRRRILGARAREYACEHFTVEEMAGAFADVYREILGARRRRLRPAPEKP